MPPPSDELWSFVDRDENHSCDFREFVMLCSINYMLRPAESKMGTDLCPFEKAVESGARSVSRSLGLCRRRLFLFCSHSENERAGACS